MKIWLIFSLSILLLVACTSYHEQDGADNAAHGIRKILILPFQNLNQIYGENVALKCSLCRRRHVIGEVAEGAEDFMTDHLVKRLREDTAYELILPEPLEGVRAGLYPDENATVSELNLMVETGAQIGADAVLIGFLFAFKERVGMRYSIESPASVSFSLFLLGVGEQHVIWSGSFDETQQSLSENLLQIGAFIRRKGRWITAREMADEGLKEVMKTFPIP